MEKLLSLGGCYLSSSVTYYQVGAWDYCGQDAICPGQ